MFTRAAAFRWLWALLAVWLASAPRAELEFSPPIIQIEVSRDGQFAAILREGGALGVTRLGERDTLHPLSASARPRVSWSPTGHTLAWVEQPDNAPMALCIADAGNPTRHEALLKDADYKADPAWLTDKTLAYLSDRASTHVNIWTLGIARGQVINLLNRLADVQTLWGNPRGGMLLFESAETGAPELYAYSVPGDVLKRLTNDALEVPPVPRRVAFDAQGALFAYTTNGSTSQGLVLRDAQSHGVGELRLDAPAQSLAITAAGHVLAAQGNSVLEWNLRPGWFQNELTHYQYGGGVPLGPLATGPGKSVLAALNQNLLLMAPSVARLARGERNAAELSDWIGLAQAERAAGDLSGARGVLAELYGVAGAAPGNPTVQLQAAAARAQLERVAGRFRSAAGWLARPPDGQSGGQTWRDALAAERVAVAFFERDDAKEAAALALTQNVQNIQPRTLLEWIAKFNAQSQASEVLAWRAGGAALRAGSYQSAALALAPQLAAEGLTTQSLIGLNLLLGGAFEPLGELNGADQKSLAGMLHEPIFQRSLIGVAQVLAAREGNAARHFPRGAQRDALTSADLFGLLLQQWAQEGNYPAARELVRSDLTRPGPPLLQYGDMLRQSLVTEETAAWTKALYARVLFDAQITPLLQGRLTTPADAQALNLARTKAALLAGNLREADRLLSASLQMNIAEVFPRTLFEAKCAEGRGRYAAAREAYRRCLAAMEQPGNWDANPAEICRQLALLDAAEVDPDGVASYLRVQRALGDPLLSPTRAPNVVHSAEQNWKTLLQYGASPQLRPFLLAGLGSCASLVGENYRALGYFQQALDAGTPAGLQQAIWLEQGAVRDNLGQHALAARIYGKIAAQPDLPGAVLTSARQAERQARRVAGMGF